MIKYMFIIWVSTIKLVELSKLLWKHKIWSLLQDFSSRRRLSYILIYVIPQGKDTALRCRFRCQNYLSLSWDFFRVLCCLPSACNCLSLSRTLSFSGGLLGFSFSLTCCSHLERSRLYCSSTPFIFRKVWNYLSKIWNDFLTEFYISTMKVVQL